MIRVKIEVVPQGDERAAKAIGLLEITNVGGTDEFGDYWANIVSGKDGTMTTAQSCHIEGFERKRGAVALVTEALKRLVCKTD